MNARIDRQDLKVAHEPSHRLVKVRTVVLERQLGRVHTAALVAFERARTLCAKIAESHQRFLEEDKKGEVAGPATRNLEPTPKETLTESGDGLPSDHAPDVPNNTTVESRDGGASSKGTRYENLQDGKQPQDSKSLSCDKCRGRLSFPCWYCIYCEGQSRRLTCSPRVLRPSTTLLDDLFLCRACEAGQACQACELDEACQACDRKVDLELMQGSGKHTEDHHLIRCLAPEKDDDALSSTERRLISLESRMQSQFDNMESRIGNIEQLLHKLSSTSTETVAQSNPMLHLVSAWIVLVVLMTTVPLAVQVATLVATVCFLLFQ
jgi:hypothetical protein